MVNVKSALYSLCINIITFVYEVNKELMSAKAQTHFMSELAAWSAVMHAESAVNILSWTWLCIFYVIRVELTRSL